MGDPCHSLPVTSHVSIPPPRLPPPPDLQPLDPTPYKRVSAPLETSSTLIEAPDNSTLLEKPTTHSFSQTTTQAKYPTVSTPGTPFSHVPTLKCGPTSLLDNQSIVIHAQTVIINNYSTTGSKNRGAIFSDDTEHPKHSSRIPKDKPHAPVSPTISTMPPRDLSALRSRSHPFSSLQRRSHRRQSLPARGHNWDSYFHHRNFGRARGWAPSLY